MTTKKYHTNYTNRAEKTAFDDFKDDMITVEEDEFGAWVYFENVSEENIEKFVELVEPRSKQSRVLRYLNSQ